MNHRMENSINLKIDLPPDIIKKLENVIIETVTKPLQEHVANIKAEPKMYTRKEAANALRITLQTPLKISSPLYDPETTLTQFRLRPHLTLNPQSQIAASCPPAETLNEDKT